MCAALSSFFFLADAIAYLITHQGTLSDDNPYGTDPEAQPAQRHERWRSALGTAQCTPFIHETRTRVCKHVHTRTHARACTRTHTHTWQETCWWSLSRQASSAWSPWE